MSGLLVKVRGNYPVVKNGYVGLDELQALPLAVPAPTHNCQCIPMPHYPYQVNPRCPLSLRHRLEWSSRAKLQGRSAFP